MECAKSAKMSISTIAWTGLEKLRSAGFDHLAATLGNRVASDRHFSIDEAGHWINRQADATFVSPDVHAQRLAFVTDKVRDEWYWAAEPRGIVFDIGAGIGEDSVVMATTADHVYAIEAHPDVFACLEKTIRLSGLTNVTAIHCALSDEDGVAHISSDEHHLANGIAGADGIPVTARSLHSLCAQLGVRSIDFLKMNIEGAEQLAIKGFGDIPIRQVAISCHDFVPGKFTQTREIVRKFLIESGYSVKQRTDHPRPWTRNTLYGEAG